MAPAIFGKLMESSGGAEVLANAAIERLVSNRAMLAVVLSCAAMTYGGVSLFVVAFAVFGEAVTEPSVGSVGDSCDSALAETNNGLDKAEVVHRFKGDPRVK